VEPLSGLDNDGLLYLNDGDREETPEYAALKIEQVDGLMVSGREVGRIRPLGMDVQKVQQFVQDMRQGRWSMDSPLKVKAEPEWRHGCELVSSGKTESSFLNPGL
jgi:hypothetical protein